MTQYPTHKSDCPNAPGSGVAGTSRNTLLGRRQDWAKIGVAQKKSSEAKSAKRRPVTVFGVITTQILWIPFFQGSGT